MRGNKRRTWLGAITAHKKVISIEKASRVV